ncbi:hypothetical protein SAMN05216188_109131 [Lentzea xinjiangensis]|uniref:Secreted protein n=1 Tax=Lentzea xinjiangensis TaxID=402600 RepID=A0A1H9MM89_9PSEU|nr:hypothetical protein [Lentzea xinjiangensis]SER24671.1 hypothetical protein SAMN05216188_109131 [Lentzea xinjiangensis]
MFVKIASSVGTAALVVGALLGIASPANAETNPNCSQVTQIGETAYIKSGGTTVASVKQFKGCNKNWAYTYVWEGFRNSHSGTWWACSGVSTSSGLADYKCGGNHQKEVWSSGANTLSVCTKAYGQLEWSSGEGYAATDQRC